MPAVDMTKESSTVQKPKPSWKKSSAEERESFTQTLRAKLESLKVPGAINCRNPTCDIPEHRVDSDGYVEEILNAISDSAAESLSWNSGQQSCNSSSNKKKSWLE